MRNFSGQVNTLAINTFVEVATRDQGGRLDFSLGYDRTNPGCAETLGASEVAFVPTDAYIKTGEIIK